MIGMLSNKDLDAYLHPFAGRIAHIHALPVPGHDHHPPERFAAIADRWGIACTAHATPEGALAAISAQPGHAPKLLICGSLYLAGEILLIGSASWRERVCAVGESLVVAVISNKKQHNQQIYK